MLEVAPQKYPFGDFDREIGRRDAGLTRQFEEAVDESIRAEIGIGDVDRNAAHRQRIVDHRLHVEKGALHREHADGGQKARIVHVGQEQARCQQSLLGVVPAQ